MMPKPPNVLLIVSDQHRAKSLGCYGNDQIITPNLNRLADDGCVFDNAVSTSPVCAPFRVCFQTGLYPHQHGVRGNLNPLKNPPRGMGEIFSENGYNTCFVGKSHFGLDPVDSSDGWQPEQSRFGWKTWLGTGGDHHYDTRIYDKNGELDKTHYGKFGATVRTDLAIDFLKKASSDPDPWILNLNYSEPHQATLKELYELPYTMSYVRELNKKHGLNLDDEMLRTMPPTDLYRLFPQSLLTQIVPQVYLDMYKLEDIKLDPNVNPKYTALEKHIYLEYYAMLTAMDAEIGRLLGFLTETSQLDNTVIVYSSDHGDMLGSTPGTPRQKAIPYQNAYRVPLIIHGGKNTDIAQGERNKSVFNTLDFLPTLMDLCGIESDPTLMGQSLAAAWTGSESHIRNVAYLELDPWRAIFDGDHLYSVSQKDGQLSPDLLIDLQKDLLDEHNLIQCSEHKMLQENLQGQLVEQAKATGDDFFEKNL